MRETEARREHIPSPDHKDSFAEASFSLLWWEAEPGLGGHPTPAPGPDHRQERDSPDPTDAARGQRPGHDLRALLHEAAHGEPEAVAQRVLVFQDVGARPQAWVRVVPLVRAEPVERWLGGEEEERVKGAQRRRGREWEEVLGWAQGSADTSDCMEARGEKQRGRRGGMHQSEGLIPEGERQDQARTRGRQDRAPVSPVSSPVE